MILHGIDMSTIASPSGSTALFGVGVVLAANVCVAVVLAGFVGGALPAETDALGATVNVTAIAGAVNTEEATTLAAGNDQTNVQSPSPGRKLDHRFDLPHSRGQTVHGLADGRPMQ
jgi:hypothetical protein